MHCNLCIYMGLQERFLFLPLNPFLLNFWPKKSSLPTQVRLYLSSLKGIHLLPVQSSPTSLGKSLYNELVFKLTGVVTTYLDDKRLSVHVLYRPYHRKERYPTYLRIHLKLERDQEE